MLGQLLRDVVRINYVFPSHCENPLDGIGGFVWEVLARDTLETMRCWASCCETSCGLCAPQPLWKPFGRYRRFRLGHPRKIWTPPQKKDIRARRRNKIKNAWSSVVAVVVAVRRHRTERKRKKCTSLGSTWRQDAFILSPCVAEVLLVSRQFVVAVFSFDTFWAAFRRYMAR